MNAETECDGQHLSATVRWQRTFDNYSPITHYLVEYSTNHNPDVWKVAAVSSILDEDLFACVLKKKVRKS